MTANTLEIETICECQYTLMLSGDGENMRKFKDNSTDVPSIHEIDEEDSEVDEETTVLERPGPSNKKNDVQETPEDESTYTNESFYSDESEVTDVTPGSSVSNSSLLLHIAEPERYIKSAKLQHSDSSGPCLRNDKFYLSSDEPFRAATADKLIKSRRCKRWNMSFTDEEMRRIERENELLLRKIMAQQKPRHKVLGERFVQPKTSSSAINRKRWQKKIEDDNMLLLRKIQQAKPCVLANASKVGCRSTFL